ncbi:MAG: endonuclease/exonuclease/phosphatase family protein [Planctomycetota bacterium]
MKPGLKYRYTKLLTFCLFAMGVLGLFLQLTTKDRAAVLAPAFYGLAPLVVVGALAVSLGLSLRFAPRWWGVALGVVLIVAILTWIETDYVRSATRASSENGLKIVLWNIARPSDKEDGFVSVLKKAAADIVVLVESGGNGESRRKFWTSHFPDHHVSLLGGGVALLARYRISNAVMHNVGYKTRLGVYDLDTPFGPLSVVAVDLPANPLVRREPLIDRAYDIAISKPHPVVVLGDFNTPHTSVLFEGFRRSFKHAFEESGNGLITTWPAFLPLLALDHIWLSGHFVALCTAVRRTWHSDHGLVVAEVKLKEQN